MQSVAIFGRQPELSVVELECLYGHKGLRLLTPTVAALDTHTSEIRFEQLGGVTKLGRILAIIPSTNWGSIESYLLSHAPEHAALLSDGKIHIGISVYGIRARVDDIQRTSLALKKAIRATGRSVRVVPNKTVELNSAQVLHNHLTGERGWELLLIADGHQTILAQTVAVQDIEAYAARDQARPMRDARVGMLPPKLAQLIINLARGPATVESQEPRVKSHEVKPLTLLDPFCGTGVVLQEALLDGLSAYGTDLEPRMVDYSRGNLEWLLRTHRLSTTTFALEQGDATTHRWQPFDLVAAETYLGQPLSGLPSPEKLQRIIDTVDQIHVGFLKNLAAQARRGTRICLAVPAWHTNSGVLHLPILDRLGRLGYTRASFVHARDRDLIYHRPGQIVGRELVVLVKN